MKKITFIIFSLILFISFINISKADTLIVGDVGCSGQYISQPTPYCVYFETVFNKENTYTTGDTITFYLNNMEGYYYISPITGGGDGSLTPFYQNSLSEFLLNGKNLISDSSYNGNYSWDITLKNQTPDGDYNIIGKWDPCSRSGLYNCPDEYDIVVPIIIANPYIPSLKIR